MLRGSIASVLGLSGDPNGIVVLRKGADNELSSTIDEIRPSVSYWPPRESPKLPTVPWASASSWW